MVYPKEKDQVLQVEHLCIKCLIRSVSIRFTDPVIAHVLTVQMNEVDFI